MAKLTTSDLTSLTNQASAVATINANFALVETAMENTLSRDGTTPNTMTADLDLNSNDLLNGGAASFTSLTVNGEAISDFVQAAENSASAAAASASAASSSASSAAASAASVTGSVASASASALSAAASAVSASAANTTAQGYATSASAANVTAQGYATSASAAAGAAQAYMGGVFFDFATSTTMADPSTGNVRLNNATLSSVTNIALSALSAATGNPDISDYVITWDDSTNTTIKGTLNITKGASPGTTLIYNVTGSITDNGTWLQIPVTYVSHVGTWSAGDDMYISFSRAGNKGADGAGNVASVTAADTSITVAGTAANPTISRAALTGDVTASAGSNTTTIANDAVTYAKMQNVSAAARILGRGSASSGDPQELTVGLGLEIGATSVNALAASETVAGVAEIATAAETTTGTDDTRVISPLKLTTFAPASATADTANDKVLFADASDSYKLKQGTFPSASGKVTPFRINSTANTAIVSCASGGTRIGSSFLATIPTSGKIRISIVQANISWTQSVNVSVGASIEINGTTYFATSSINGTSNYIPFIAQNGSSPITLFRGAIANTGIWVTTLDIQAIGCSTGSQTCYLKVGHSANTAQTDVPTLNGGTNASIAMIEIIDET